MTKASLIPLLLLLASAPVLADEPFVTQPSRKAAAWIYGTSLTGDAASTLWARSRSPFVAELNHVYPILDEPVVMVASRAALAGFLIWLDPKLHPILRWTLRILTAGYYSYRTIANIQVGRRAAHANANPR